ncbi:MAG: hypothetical protein ACQETH_14595 [Candidatus Rifleibacteriota bacterium]
MLGISSNFTTLVGLVLIWILLVRSQTVEGTLATLIAVLAFTPVFMADAINHYCLGRIRLEHYKGWSDIQITPEGRSKTAHNYFFYRAISIIPAYLLAASFFASFNASPEVVSNLKLAFLSAFVLHFARATWFLQAFIAPKLSGFGGKRLVIRTFIAASTFLMWFVWFWSPSQTLSDNSYSNTAIFFSGVFYFFLNSFLHPLPARYSLLRKGKRVKSKAFFRVERLEDRQLNSLGNSKEIAEISEKGGEKLGFEHFANLRMPLIELPLFQCWGKAFSSPDGCVALLFLDSEVKRGVHRSLISMNNKNIYITTDFGSPQARFPENVKYRNFARNTDAKELLSAHHDLIKNVECYDIRETIENRLEEFIKDMIKFLENNAAVNRNNDRSDNVKSTDEVSEGEKNG